MVAKENFKFALRGVFLRTVLVLGGAGFIGRAVVACFLRYGWAVRVLDARMPIDSDARIDWRVGTTSDVAVLRSAAKDVNVVIDLSGRDRPGVHRGLASDHIKDNVFEPVSIAETCKAEGVSTFIYASSGGTVYGNRGAKPISEGDPCSPLSLYGLGKYCVELYLNMLNSDEFKVVVLRIGNPYGEGQVANGQGFIAALLSSISKGGRFEVWGDGRVVRDFLYVDDVAAAFFAAANYTGKDRVFNIGSGKGHSLLEVLATVSKILDRDLDVVFRESRTLDVNSSILSIDLARSELGWSPLVSFDEGIKRSLLWWGLSRE